VVLKHYSNKEKEDIVEEEIPDMGKSLEAVV
jgi:hypothetical protein